MATSLALACSVGFAATDDESRAHERKPAVLDHGNSGRAIFDGVPFASRTAFELAEPDRLRLEEEAKKSKIPLSIVVLAFRLKDKPTAKEIFDAVEKLKKSTAATEQVQLADELANLLGPQALPLFQTGDKTDMLGLLKVLTLEKETAKEDDVLDRRSEILKRRLTPAKAPAPPPAPAPADRKLDVKPAPIGNGQQQTQTPGDPAKTPEKGADPALPQVNSNAVNAEGNANQDAFGADLQDDLNEQALQDIEDKLQDELDRVREELENALDLNQQNNDRKRGQGNDNDQQQGNNDDSGNESLPSAGGGGGGGAAKYENHDPNFQPIVPVQPVQAPPPITAQPVSDVKLGPDLVTQLLGAASGNLPSMEGVRNAFSGLMDDVSKRFAPMTALQQLLKQDAVTANARAQASAQNLSVGSSATAGSSVGSALSRTTATMRNLFNGGTLSTARPPGAPNATTTISGIKAPSRYGATSRSATAGPAN